MTGSRIAGDIQAAQPEVLIRAVEILTVVGLGDNPGEVAVSDGSTEKTIGCLDGYRYRAVGDVVLAIQIAGGTWQVLGKMGAAGDSQDVPSMISAAIAAIDLPPTVSVSWGSGAPFGTGWKTGSTVYVRDDGSGDRSIYFDTTSSPTDPGTTRPAGAPASVDLPADDQGGWRESSSQTDDTVKAGAWTGSDWFGGWFYGTAIAAACAGKTVAKMTVKLARKDNNAGWDRGVPVHIGLHTRTTKGQPTITNTWTPSHRLSKGTSYDYEIPASQRAQLASGAARGIGVTGSGPDDYLHFSGSARIHIDFSA